MLSRILVIKRERSQTWELNIIVAVLRAHERTHGSNCGVRVSVKASKAHRAKSGSQSARRCLHPAYGKHTYYAAKISAERYSRSLEHHAVQFSMPVCMDPSYVVYTRMEVSNRSVAAKTVDS